MSANEEQVEIEQEKVTVLCTVGKYEESREIDKNSCSGEMILREQLSDDDVRLLKIRGGCKKKIKTVCERHYKKFLASYASHQLKCCNPFRKHLDSMRKRPKARSLKEITLEMRDIGKLENLSLIPGQKLCVACNLHFHSLFAKKKNITLETGTEAASEESAIKSTTDETTAPETSGITRSDQLDLAQTLHASPPSLPTSSNQETQQSYVLSNQSSFVQESLEYLDENFPGTIDLLNKWLLAVGKKSLSLNQLTTSTSYLERTMNDIREVLEKYSGRNPSEEISEMVKKAALFDEILMQLKDFVTKHKKSYD